MEYKNKLPDFENIDVIIITHSHFDHFQPKVIEKILSKNQNCKIFTTIDNASNILNSYAVKDGDMINVSEFSLQFYGNNHSEIIA
ncbi:MAG: MBL fold metallo-hydrolase [Candidatus Peribacteria bacterium]|nr:MBL fold metallo-hydrolase [Candidatus Peribacteria bacterium]